MADDTHSKRTSRGLGFPVATVFILLLYVLSPGPVARLVDPQGKPPRAFEIAYAPLTWSCRHVPGVRQFYAWYFKVWGVDL